jgi:dihydropteroate synthase
MVENAQSIGRREPPRIMGILNVTDDSFYDGGRYRDPSRAAERAAELFSRGADIVDIGAESSRPGSEPIPEELELERVLAVLERIEKPPGRLVSVDTSRGRVARCALEHGADWVNDIYALRRDPAMIEVLRDFGCPVILMHMQGTPETMQTAPAYGDVVEDVFDFLVCTARRAVDAGLRGEQIILDPGIGFGKTLEHNLALLRSISRFREAGFPLCVGPSRKSFLGAITGRPAEERLFGTAAAVAHLVSRNVEIIRVHDVAAMRDVASVAARIAGAENREVA